MEHSDHKTITLVTSNTRVVIVVAVAVAVDANRNTSSTSTGSMLIYNMRAISGQMIIEMVINPITYLLRRAQNC